MGRNREREASSADADPPVSLDSIPLHSTNLLTVLDETGVVKYESPSIERIYGFDQGELVGDQVADYFHPEDRAAVVEAFATLVASDEYTVEAVEYRHERADGTYCWVESVAASDPTPEGHYVVNTRDVSDRKARERELEATNRRLEEFANVLSHDLRNPLTVAEGSLELAREERDSEHLAAVARAHDRMETLIDRLLGLARTGDDPERYECLDLADLVADCWATVATDGADLVVDVDGRVRADESRLMQVFENLFRNCVEHGSGEDPTDASVAGRGSDEAVTVTVGDLPDGFYVADDGPGVPASERGRIFEGGYSTGSGGTGFGLHIVEEAVADHGWDVAVRESADGGARFEVTGVERPAE